jgi:hypothetical protein
MRHSLWSASQSSNPDSYRQSGHRSSGVLGGRHGRSLCGTSLAGSSIRSFTFTDILSQWTENRAVWNKGLPTSWPTIWPLSELGPPDGHGRAPHRHGPNATRCCEGRFRTAGDGVTRRCSYCSLLPAFVRVSRDVTRRWETGERGTCGAARRFTIMRLFQNLVLLGIIL